MGNHNVYQGINDLKTWCEQNGHMELLLEWHPTKNGNLYPTDVAKSSCKKVWWLGKCGHEWSASVNNRTSKSCHCPYCSGQQVLAGFNDLQTKYPEIAKEWHPMKNGLLTPKDVMAGTPKKVWWLGKCGHEWPAQIVSRTFQGSGCPYCSGQQVLIGFNDLQTKYPEIAAEWHPIKNGTLLPTDFTKGAGKKIWWLGKCGHEWYTSIYSRTSQGSGCPKCNEELHTSFAEQAIFYYIKQYYPDAINGDKEAIGMELDIYIPSCKIAIEYDGMAYHKNRKTDARKNELCKRSNILLIRVQEQGVPGYTDCFCIKRKNEQSKEDLSSTIRQLFYDIDNKLQVDINVIRDETKILSQYVLKKKDASLASLYPEIASEWHPVKNDLLLPTSITKGSNKTVWWLGKCGHEWPARVISRTSKGTGCPYCSGQQVLIGFNDLATLYPEIAKEWHPTKNGDLCPIDFTKSSSKRIWWLDKCGHEWAAPIFRRIAGTGCPYCAGKQVLIGFNDLVTVCPEIAEEWHPTKNNNLQPTDFTKSSHKRVWWLGKCGHEWSARIYSRTAHKTSCPVCRKNFRTSVQCIETGKIYFSLSEAERNTKAARRNIVRCCKDQQQTAGGYHWKYIE